MDDTCPGCDGTITRALMQGREITTYERCQRCEDLERDLFDRFSDSLIVRPNSSLIRYQEDDRG